MPSEATPDLARLLGPIIETVPESARPSLLADLERGAAQRYRAWAALAGGISPDLRACADREEEIAERAERVVPADPNDRPAIEVALPRVRDAFLAIFDGLPLREQFRMQASAERQGAAAWRGVASQQEDAAIRAELESCALLEEQNAACLEKLVAEPDLRTGRWRTAPVLGVRNVREAAEYYRDVLGFHFEPDAIFEGVGDEATGVYGIVHRGSTSIHFQIRRGDVPARDREPIETDVYVYVDDVERLYEELKAKGASIRGEPRSMPYGLREIIVDDPSGHCLTFGAPLNR